jgi:glc operon protein GlcG
MKTSFDERMGAFLAALDTMIPEYGANPSDAFAEGNVAVVVLDSDGRLSGRVWGENKVKGRQFFNLACKKATQVWITGMKTGEYEKRLYAGEFDEEKFGINKPDLIGWEGGQPVAWSDGVIWAVGFSGFRGFNDLGIVDRAVEQVEKGMA